MSRPHGQYQNRDWDVVDYEGFEIKGLPYVLRGPKPKSTKDGNYGMILGAGQSFGVLVRRPYAHMITEDFDLPMLNLSVGGSAPQLYLNNQAALEPYRNAKFVIVQVLSARSSKTSYFETRDGKNMLRPAGSSLPYVPGDTAYTAMFENEPEPLVRAVIGELRANWMREMTELLSLIKAPKILLWFSKRSPDIEDTFDDYRKSSGVFPQFVNRDMVDAVRRHADFYVEGQTKRGVPNQLVNRFTGEPAQVMLGDKKLAKSEDYYYPSPEMHEDVYALLKPVISEITGQEMDK